MGDTSGAVLVAAGVTAVGIALGVANEDGDIAIEDILVHQDGVAALGGTQVDHVLVVLT